MDTSWLLMDYFVRILDFNYKYWRSVWKVGSCCGLIVPFDPLDEIFCKDCHQTHRFPTTLDSTWKQCGHEYDRLNVSRVSWFRYGHL